MSSQNGAFKCFRCVDTGEVLGIGLFNFEPCPRCRPEEREAWEEREAAKRGKEKQRKENVDDQ